MGQIMIFLSAAELQTPFGSQDKNNKTQVSAAYTAPDSKACVL